MGTGINSACPLFLRRPDSQRASNIPDAGMLRKMVRERACRPVLRGVLDSLLHYLTQDLPKRAAQDRNLEKGQIGGSGQRTENSKKLQNSCGDLVPRHLTTFQLLQAKFVRSGSKAPASHRREVGPLGATGDLKTSKGDDPEAKSQTRRGQGHKRGGSVKDIVAKFAVADHKEKGGKALKIQLAGRGTALRSLMERFEAVAAVRKASAVARVRLPSDVKQMVAHCERRQREGEAESVREENRPRKMGIQPDSEGHGSSRGQEQGRGPSTPQIRLKPKKPHLKPEDRCSIQSEKDPDCDKTEKNSVQLGEIQSGSEEANVTAHLNGDDGDERMVLHLKSVTETFLPEPYKLVPQVEAQPKCCVGTTIASSPVWSTRADHAPEPHPAEPPETTAQPLGAAAGNGSCLNPQGEEEDERGAEGDGLNLPESSMGQRSGPAYLIPRVSTLTFPHHVKDHARSTQLPAADSERNFLNAAQPAYWDSPDTGPVACPPANTEKPIVQKMKKDSQTGDEHHGKEEKTKEPTPEVTENPNTQLIEETTAQDAPKGAIPAGSSPEGHRPADDQKLRPKYKTINYGDPSITETYKPKIIRFTDTFTF